MTKVSVNDIESLTGKQEDAAYLLALGARVGEVAQKLSVSRGTVSNWKGIDAFRVRVNQIQTERRRALERKMHALGEKAVARLEQLIESDDERAALDSIKFLMRIAGLDDVKLVIGPTTVEDLQQKDKQEAEMKDLVASLCN